MVNPPPIQTQSDIRRMLSDAGLTPLRQHGQHFLIDGNLMRRLLDAAELEPDDVVLEVGPGTGSLTEQLAARAERVIAVEIDRGFFQLLTRRLVNTSNVQLFHTDVLANKHTIVKDVIKAIQNGREATPGRLQLVANLPYNIATPLILNLLMSPIGFDRLCFSVQKEVGDRLTATPATRNFGPISVLVQATCEIRQVAVLPPQVFWPRPAVDSVMMRLDVFEGPFRQRERLAPLSQVVHAGFAHRRKTLRYNLGTLASPERLESLESQLDLSRRAETLSVREWITLANFFQPHLNSGP